MAMPDWTPGTLLPSGIIAAGVPAVPRLWPVYQISAEGGEYNGTPFLFFVERGGPAYLSVETLPEAEMFNAELQKVDVTSTASLLAFCEQYGIPVSPVYPGAARLEWFRRRFDPGVRTFVPIDTSDEERATRALDPRAHHVEMLCSPESLDRELPWDQLGCRPGLLSERARELVLGDRDAVGAVSEAEVAQTIRALQIATVLPMAYGYFSRNGGTADDLLGYLSEKRYLSQAGPDYFLHVDDDIVRGSRLDTFENAMRSNPGLPDEVRSAERMGFNVRAAYDDAVADGLWRATNNSLRFLMESDSSYRRCDFEYEWGSPPPQAPAGILGRFARLLSGSSGGGRLPDFSLTGSIGEALIYQFLRIYADPTPWRRCENCQRIFKKYREEGFAKNIRETRFCRRSCNVSFNQKQRSK